MADGSKTHTVAAVNIRLSPFWPADPQVRFMQVEAEFTTSSITVQRTKFEHIVASPFPDIATKVRDLILMPPADQPYNTLKKQLVKCTATSKQRRLQQLLMHRSS